MTPFHVCGGKGSFFQSHNLSKYRNTTEIPVKNTEIPVKDPYRDLGDAESCVPGRINQGPDS